MTSPKEDQQPMTTREELVGLHSRYLTMTGQHPTAPWDQGAYDRLVLGLLQSAPGFLASRQEVSVEELASIYGTTLARALLAEYSITKREG